MKPDNQAPTPLHQAAEDLEYARRQLHAAGIVIAAALASIGDELAAKAKAKRPHPKGSP